MELTLDLNKRYTYADYLTWFDDKRRELLDGIVHLFAAAPSKRHQKVAGRLFAKMFNIIEKHKGTCEVYHAPFDVRLPKNGERADDKIYTVVQPDVCIVCDPAKLDDQGCLGAPDLMVEVKSISTRDYDMTEKFRLYEASGVLEYWIVSPFDNMVDVFLLQPNGKYDEGTRYTSGYLPIQALGGIRITLRYIFKP
jgi:Uma2 family endonuclease